MAAPRKYRLPSLDNPLQARLIADRVVRYAEQLRGEDLGDHGDDAMADMLETFAAEITAVHSEERASSNGHVESTEPAYE